MYMFISLFIFYCLSALLINYINTLIALKHCPVHIHVFENINDFSFQKRVLLTVKKIITSYVRNLESDGETGLNQRGKSSQTELDLLWQNTVAANDLLL